MGSAAVYSVTWSLFFKGRNVNPEGLVRTQWAVNPSVALQGVSASVRKVGRGSGRTAQHLLSHRLHVRHLCGILDKDSWYFDTTTRAGHWQMKTSACCWCEGLFTWTDHLSRSAEGTWVNFMVRLFYHLALSVLFSCGNPGPALSGRRLQWTPRGESHGLH